MKLNPLQTQENNTILIKVHPLSLLSGDAPTQHSHSTRSHLPDVDELVPAQVVVVEAVSGLYHQQHLPSQQLDDVAVSGVRYLQTLGQG